MWLWISVFLAWQTAFSTACSCWAMSTQGRPASIISTMLRRCPSARFSRLVIDTEGSRDDFPHQFEIRTSSDGTHWSNPVAKGPGKPLLEIDLPAGTVARYLRIVQTAPPKGGNFWSVHEVSIYGAQDDGAK